MGPNETDIVGVYILNAQEGYPAEEAGIKAGDVVTEFDGIALQTPYELFAEMLKHDVGDIVKLTIYRGGRYLEFELELVEAPYTEDSGQE
jgi:serine protease Do